MKEDPLIDELEGAVEDLIAYGQACPDDTPKQLLMGALKTIRAVAFELYQREKLHAE